MPDTVKLAIFVFGLSVRLLLVMSAIVHVDTSQHNGTDDGVTAWLMFLLWPHSL